MFLIIFVKPQKAWGAGIAQSAESTNNKVINPAVVVRGLPCPHETRQ
jgi:hypothetical protein